MTKKKKHKKLTKKCCKCHQKKPISRFYHNQGTLDGRNSWCIECVTHYQRLRYHESKHNEKKVIKKERISNSSVRSFVDDND